MDKSDTNDKENKFDLRQFNKEFIKKREKTKKDNKIRSQKKLDLLTQESNIENEKIQNQSIIQLVIGIKNTWFDILDDMLGGKIKLTTFTKNNRLFYIGLTVIIIVLIFYIINFFIGDEDEDGDKKEVIKIIEKHYVEKINVPETVKN